MNHFINSFFEKHELLSTLLFGILLLFVWWLFNLAVEELLSKLNYDKRLKYSYIKSTVIGIAIPIVGVYLWYNHSQTPFNEFKLITNSKITKGFINNVRQESEVEEYNDGRNTAVVYYYVYEYSFILHNEIEYKNVGKEDGYVPDYLSDVSNSPYPIQVEFLASNPLINRVKGMPSNHTTLYEFFRFTILQGLLVLVVCVYFGYIIFKSGKSKYKAEIKS
jgi:hypothetical protein